MAAQLIYRPATEQDVERIWALLQSCTLPTADLPQSRPEFTVACAGADIVAVGGVERFGATGLLRSVAVSEDHRGFGIGQAIIADLERRAFTSGITDLVLLTETARTFFEHQGYRVIERDRAPASVQASSEFRSLCPQSACCMTKRLWGGLTTMETRPYNVLFLCTGNSARSILAECLINHWGQGRFRGFSAGSHPGGEVNPVALELLKQMNMPTEALRSKSWGEFAVGGAQAPDFVFTVCDNAAAEVCPIWPGHPMTAHWGVPDPAAVEGAHHEKMAAFREAWRMLERRIRLFVSLPVQTLDGMALKRSIDEIGKAS